MLTANDTRTPVRQYRKDLTCFERTRLPASHQLSRLPEEAEAGVKYYKADRQGKVQEVSRQQVGQGHIE